MVRINLARLRNDLRDTGEYRHNPLRVGFGVPRSAKRIWRHAAGI